MQIVKAAVDAYHYDIILENGLTGRLGDRLNERFHPRRALLVTDENVGSLYGARVMRSLQAAMIDAQPLTLKAGGYPGTLDALREISAHMADMALSREDALIVMGGGSLCDTGGFAAWNYRDLIRLVQVPTTLIGIADWAVAGKTALEYKPGSRMIGSFFPPSLVLIDPQTVSTMPDRAFYSGMGEVVKCGCAADAPLFHMLETLSGRAAVQARMEEIAWRCLEIKNSLAGANRQKVLLGHGVAHAIETAQHYRGLLHGEAVGVGMLAVTRFSERAGFTTRGTAARLAECLGRYHLPLTAAVDPQTMLKRLQALGTALEAVVPERVGWTTVQKVDNAFFTGAWFG
ncbi:MAG: 3-dehydroquinate synthase [Clostridia bacterium]|nr:3-dehydroquinate synthase [Clostridia bacterium]